MIKVCEDCTHNRYCGGEYVDEKGCFYKHVKDENGVVYPRPEEVNGDNKEEKEMKKEFDQYIKNVDVIEVEFMPEDSQVKFQVKSGENIYLFLLEGKGVKIAAEDYTKLKTENFRLKVDQDKLLEKIELLKQVNDKLKQDNYNLTCQNNVFAAQNNRLKREQRERDKLFEKHNALVLEHDSLLEKYKEQEAKIADLRIEKNRIEADRKRIIEEHKKSDDEQCDRYKALYDEFRQLKQDNDKNIKRNKELNKQIDEMVLNTNKKVNTDEEPSSRRDILRCAEKCICGKREQDYGTPESNFQIIADLWNGYLGGKTDNPVISVTPVDVSMMMALLKIARIRNGGGTGDSFVDLAGYAACGGEINAQKKATKTN